MEETIEIIVPHYFNHPIYFPFMSEHMFEILHDAFTHHQEKATVPKNEYERMLKAYYDTLWN